MSDEPFTAAREILKTLSTEFGRLEAKLAEGHALSGKNDQERAVRRAELAAHEKRLADLTARQVAEHEARKKELAVEAAHLAEQGRQLEEGRRRVEQQQQWIEHRAADLGNRMRGVA